MKLYQVAQMTTEGFRPDPDYLRSLELARLSAANRNRDEKGSGALWVVLCFDVLIDKDR